MELITEKFLLDMINDPQTSFSKMLITFIMAWFLLRRMLHGPITEFKNDMNKRFTEMQNELKGFGSTLRDVETGHARQLSLLEQGSTYTRAEIQETKHKLERLEKKVAEIAQKPSLINHS